MGSSREDLAALRRSAVCAWRLVHAVRACPGGLWTLGGRPPCEADGRGAPSAAVPSPCCDRRDRTNRQGTGVVARAETGGVEDLPRGRRVLLRDRATRQLRARIEA